MLLFVLTLLTTTWYGAEWRFGKPFLDWGLPDGIETLPLSKFWMGLKFSLPFVLILTCHEFGHYFTARAYKIAVSLPYYIPLWLGSIAISPHFGTLGAFISIKDPIKSKKEYFDVGIAGPLAGFVVALVVLIYGFATLPSYEYVFQVHPEYAKYGADFAEKAYQDIDKGAGLFKLGNNLLFEILAVTVAPEGAWVPNGYEMIHYPLLYAGFLACFFTALNLFPIGQLDGGHILYGIMGRNFNQVSRVMFLALILYAGLGQAQMPPDLQSDQFNSILFGNLFHLFILYIIFRGLSKSFRQTMIYALGVFSIQLLADWAYPGIEGYPGWLFFGFVLGRFLGVYHPEAPDNRPLSKGRIILGIIAIIVFALCFSPEPFSVVSPE